MLQLLVNTADPTQNGLLDNFASPGAAVEQDFVRGDVLLAFQHIPVVPSTQNIAGRPWDSDWLASDTFQVGVGNVDLAPTGGTWPLGVLAGTISGLTVASPTEITTAAAHNLLSGDVVMITGNTGTTPSINGTFTITKTAADKFTIPVNVTVAGTGGSVYDGTTMQTLGYAISAASLTTLLSAASVKHGYPALTVALLQTGDYQVTWATAAAVDSLYSPAENLLTPASGVTVIVLVDGDSDSRASQLITLKQSLVAYSEPSTPLPSAAIAAAIFQAGDATHNKIYTLTLTDGTYGGTFSLTMTTIASVVTSFIFSGIVNANDMSLALNAGNGITDGDVAVARTGDVLTIQFQGTQKLSNAPLIAVTNVDLLAPAGVSGTINFNTFNLYLYFANTTASTGTFKFSIRRTRITGEEAEYFIHDVILKRNLLDPTSLVPLNLPAYYTNAQSLVLFLNSGPSLGITRLVGGTASDLDFMTVDDSMRGRTILVDDATYGYGSWQLSDSTHADSPGTGYLRPLGYNGTSNHNVWIRET